MAPCGDRCTRSGTEAMGTRSAVAELNEPTGTPARTYPRGVLIGIYRRAIADAYRRAPRGRDGSRQEPSDELLLGARHAVICGLLKRWSWYRVGLHWDRVHSVLSREQSRIVAEL